MFFGLFNTDKKEEEEEKEEIPDLIMMIKRSILMIQVQYNFKNYLLSFFSSSNNL